MQDLHDAGVEPTGMADVQRPRGRVHCRLEDGRILDLPVFRGILKHLADDQIPRLLQNADVARKYTREAMRKAA